MPAETRAKRSSAIGVAIPYVQLMPVPDGVVAQADRQDVAYSYSGILAASPVAGAFTQSVFESRVFASRVLSGGVI